MKLDKDEAIQYGKQLGLVADCFANDLKDCIDKVKKMSIQYPRRIFSVYDMLYGIERKGC